jgi:hypothetical protein
MTKSPIHPIVGATYKHYKSTDLEPKLYEITGIAKNSETDELLVIYKPLYTNDWMIEAQADFSARPLEMFMGMVEVDGKVLQRFEPIELSITNERPSVYFSHSRHPDYDYQKTYIELEALLPNIRWFFPHKSSQKSNPIEAIFVSGAINFVLAETSYPSTVQGMELQLAHDSKIPIFCIHKNDQKPTNAIESLTDKILSYSKTEDLKSVLSQYLQ